MSLSDLSARPYFPVGPWMITTHSPAAATLEPDDVVVAMPPLPDPTVTEVPFGPVVVEPLSPPGPLVIVVVEFEPDERRAAVLPLSVRQGRWLSITIVVPPLLPLTTATLAPAPEAVDVVSAVAIVAEPPSTPAPRTMPSRTVNGRMADSFWCADPFVQNAASGNPIPRQSSADGVENR
jgi:hypothetical protein